MNVSNRRRPIGFVRPYAVMPKTNFVLVVEPFLVELRIGRIENLLAKPFAHGAQIINVGLAVLFVGEVMQQVRRSADEAIPHVKDSVGLVRQHVGGHAKMLRVILTEQYGSLE